MRWLWPAGLLALNFVLALGWPSALLRLWFSRLWPAWSAGWQAVQQWLPFPAAFIVLPLVLAGLTVVPLLAARQQPGKGLWLLSLGLVLVISWVQLGWGLNYLRTPLAQSLQLQGGTSPEQRRALAAYLAAVLQSTASAERDVAAGVSSGARELEQLLGPLGHPGRLTQPPAHVPTGSLLRFGVAGSLFPLTLEAFVDPGLADWQQVIIGIHELSHVHGIAREDDAVLAAAIAGLRSSDPFTRYAAALDSFSRLELPRAELQELLATLPERVSADLTAAADGSRRWRSETLAGLQAAVFGLWLRLQGSEGGLADYSVGASRLPLALEAGLLP